MHDYPYPSYLKTQRKRWALTQRELGLLLGLSAEEIIRYEKLNRGPSKESLIAAEFIFGIHARRIFPALYAAVELKVAKRAALMAETLAGLTDADSLIKRQLLDEIASRVAGEKSNV